MIRNWKKLRKELHTRTTTTMLKKLYLGQSLLYRRVQGAQPELCLYLGSKQPYDHVILLLNADGTQTVREFTTDHMFRQYCELLRVPDTKVPTGQRIVYGPECRYMLASKFTIKAPSAERCNEIRESLSPIIPK